MHYPRSFLIAPLAALTLAGALTTARAADGAEALRARQQQVQPALQQSPFGQPLVLESSERDGQIAGRIDAVLDQPFARVSEALRTPQGWCEVLMLHLNTKQCQVGGSPAQPVLAVHVGRKHDQPIAQAQRVDFTFQPPVVQPAYLGVTLRAAQGPMSTSDYRIALQAMPAGEGRTFLALDYRYAYGTAARLAMRGYLATVGHDKVGFTREPGAGGAAGGFIGGMRGVVERNTMRYYLAIGAYLDSLAAGGDPAQQRERRAAAWFDATERHARQLHEMSRADYLAMKRAEFSRQDQASPAR